MTDSQPREITAIVPVGEVVTHKEATFTRKFSEIVQTQRREITDDNHNLLGNEDLGFSQTRLVSLERRLQKVKDQYHLYLDALSTERRALEAEQHGLANVSARPIRRAQRQPSTVAPDIQQGISKEKRLREPKWRLDSTRNTYVEKIKLFESQIEAEKVKKSDIEELQEAKKYFQNCHPKFGFTQQNILVNRFKVEGLPHRFGFRNINQNTMPLWSIILQIGEHKGMWTFQVQ